MAEAEKQELFLRENLQGNQFKELRQAEGLNPGRVLSLAPSVAASPPAPSRAGDSGLYPAPVWILPRMPGPYFVWLGLYCHSQHWATARPAALSSGVVKASKGIGTALARRAGESRRELCRDAGSRLWLETACPRRRASPACATVRPRHGSHPPLPGGPAPCPPPLPPCDTAPEERAHTTPFVAPRNRN